MIIVIVFSTLDEQDLCLTGFVLGRFASWPQTRWM
jgi:hypothetical protein